MKYACIVVDDEALARKVLLNYLGKVDDLDVLGEFENAEDALTFISQNKVNLVFLDIKMPEISGLDMAKMLPKGTEVIFTTAYSQHAVEGFDLEALDYLMKPIPYPRFLQAVRRFLDKQKGISDLSTTDDWFTVKDGSHMYKVLFSDILYLEGMKDYVKIHTPEKVYIQHQTLKNLEETLPISFIRTHRSYIVNIRHIKSYYASELELGQIRVPVGPGYKEEVSKLLISKSLSKS